MLKALENERWLNKALFIRDVDDEAFYKNVYENNNGIGEEEMEVELLAITPDAEKLIENCGRIAYLSFEKRAEGSEKRFIRMIIKKGHESVLEHASATFRIKGASRAFTHQLVRHRLCAYTQQSQRYVNEKEFNYIEPEVIKNNDTAHKIFLDAIHAAKDAYTDLQKLGIANQDARFVLPNAVESQIVITANFREWRHIIKLRCASDAQWEIKSVISKIALILKHHAPTVFEDMRND